MEGYIDMHCHILPGVDDGAKDVEEMKKMLKIAYKEGIRCIIATPHHHPRRGKESPEVLRKKAYAAASAYLLPTGWLSRKVGCCYVGECNDYNL